jgi:SHS2 domain-containing protein
MIAAIKALFDSITQTMKTYETKIQARTTEEVVKEKRCLKKASDITEQILILVDSYKHLFNEKDLDKYERLKKKFLKVN